MCGRKKANSEAPNQDAHLVLPLSLGVLLVAVFDGHGHLGHQSAARARGLVEKTAHATWTTGTGSRSGASAMAAMFRHVHETLVVEGLAHLSGTTATVALIDASKGTAIVAHVGDSTLLAWSSADHLDFSSREHRVDEQVQARVVANGGEIRQGTTYDGRPTTRIFRRGSEFPGLNMARSLGDQEAHDLGVTSDPDTTVFDFRVGSTMVVASDGLWDQVPLLTVQQQVIAAHGQEPTALAGALVAGARRRCRPEDDIDDITAIVVRALRVDASRGPEAAKAA